MKISEIKITPIKANDGLIAIASLVIDDQLFVGSIGIHRKLDNSGYRITYPYKKVGMKRMDIFHPIRKPVGQAIEQAIVKEVTKLFEKCNEYAGYSEAPTKKR